MTKLTRCIVIVWN